MGNSKQNQNKRSKTSNKTSNGGKKLRSEVEKLVAVQSEKIAQALVGKTIQGNMTGAKLLLDLSGANALQSEPKKKRRGPTTAQQWAMDKPWIEPEDGDRETNPELLATVA